MKNIYVEVKNTITANALINAVKAAEATENTVSATKKIAMSRDTGKLVMTIPEANTVSAALENYSKKTAHAPSAKLAKSLATAIRFKTAAACKAVKAEAVAA